MTRKYLPRVREAMDEALDKNPNNNKAPIGSIQESTATYRWFFFIQIKDGKENGVSFYKMNK
jgi:hypothetical protein